MTRCPALLMTPRLSGWQRDTSFRSMPPYKSPSIFKELQPATAKQLEQSLRDLRTKGNTVDQVDDYAMSFHATLKRLLPDQLPTASEVFSWFVEGIENIPLAAQIKRRRVTTYDDLWKVLANTDTHGWSDFLNKQLDLELMSEQLRRERAAKALSKAKTGQVGQATKPQTHKTSAKSKKSAGATSVKDGADTKHTSGESDDSRPCSRCSKHPALKHRRPTQHHSWKQCAFNPNNAALLENLPQLQNPKMTLRSSRARERQYVKSLAHIQPLTALMQAKRH